MANHKRSRYIDGINHSLPRHARRRMRERNIPIDHLWDLCEDPDAVYDDSRIENSFTFTKVMPNGKMLIAVIEARADFAIVHTVYYNTPYSEDKKRKHKKRDIEAKEKHDKHLQSNKRQMKAKANRRNKFRRP